MERPNKINLVQHIEHHFGKPIKQQRDLLQLKEDIYNSTAKVIGFNTLRRFFGLLPETKTSLKTLNTLAAYLGYNSFALFEAQTALKTDWFNWIFIHRIEVKPKLEKEDLLELNRLKNSNKNYYLYLNSIIKNYILNKNIEGFEFILSQKSLYQIDYHYLLRIANTTGVYLRTIAPQDIHLFTNLTKSKIFRESFLYLMVDYSSLFSNYGILLEAASKHENDTANRLFIKLITNYGLYLKDKTYVEIEHENAQTLHPTLLGRYYGYQLLNPKLTNIDSTINQIITASKIVNSKLNLFFEVFPALLITKRIDHLSNFINKYYEDLFDATEWQHKNEEVIYLSGQAFVFVSNKDFQNASNSLSFINIDLLVDDYRDYFGIFYLIVKYHLIKNTTQNTHQLKEIERKYQLIIKRTNFKLFDKNFLVNYFN